MQSQQPMTLSQFRFYEELNDFLPSEQRKRPFDYQYYGTPSVKDAIEAIGVPHTEVDLILVDGESVDFSRLLRGGERVAVYPVFERYDIEPVTRLRPRPLRQTRFILDVHLGKLARYMRLLGFDVLYRNDYEDHAIVRIATAGERTILTRDKGLLKHDAVDRGYWVRATEPEIQVREILHAFQLEKAARPFSRCLECNTLVRHLPNAHAMGRVPPGVAERHEEFSECRECGRVYWRGSHFDRMHRIVEELLHDS